MKATLLLMAAVGLQAAPIYYTGGFGASATISDQTLTNGQFTFTLLNTSVGGAVTAVGFDLPGMFGNTFVLDSATNTNFNLVHDVKVTAGAISEDEVFDLALLTGPTFGGGKVSEGIAPNSSATFAITGPFGGLSADQIAQSFVIRFQGIGALDKSSVSETAVGSVPEPATNALVGVGLLALGLTCLRQSLPDKLEDLRFGAAGRSDERRSRDEEGAV